MLGKTPLDRWMTTESCHAARPDPYFFPLPVLVVTYAWGRVLLYSSILNFGSKFCGLRWERWTAC